MDSQNTDRRVLTVLSRLRARVEELERERSEPIAVVGLGCRFPAGIDSAEAYWQALREGRDAVAEVPPHRWDIDAVYDPDPDAPGKTYTRRGAFLESVDQFDAAFFGIARREAFNMEPQQRMLLEVAWQAVEHAGASIQDLARTSTGVFIGISASEYLVMGVQTGGLEIIDPYSITGCTNSVASGRLSYLWSFKGPNLALDTACSSSLVAVHLAVQSLRRGECRMALAGGVSLILTPVTTVFFSKVRALSADGRCKTFDAAADGYGRGEGAGVVVLKRLSDAIADGDRILATIRGSAINHDGRTSGLTAPSGPAQEAVLKQALVDAGLEPNDVGYVEAHGTGTPLGDPIEIQAMGNVYCRDRAAVRPLLVGSVKTNLGHLETASGIAGLMKVVLSLYHGQIPPHLNLRDPSPRIPWDKYALSVVTRLTDWPAGARPIAGVSSFGFSGTNAHVILERADVPVPAPGATERPLHVLPLSAHTPEGLEELASRYRRQLAESSQPSAADICHTAGAGRSHFRYRRAVVGDSNKTLLEQLNQPVNAASAPAASGEEPRVAFLFTGQGAQYAGMGRQLFETHPEFRAHVEQCDRILKEQRNLQLLEVMYSSDSAQINATEFAQPALFAVEYALAMLWRSWGVTPAWVLGHSLGEYVAACVAGAFTLEEGLLLVADRAALMQELPADGAMVAVFATAESMRPLLERNPRCVISAYNGPNSVVLAGPEREITAVMAALQSGNIRHQRLAVSRAFHCPMIEPILNRFRERAGRVAARVPELGLISNVSGDAFAAGQVPDGSYWARHAREPVQFEKGVRRLVEKNCDVLIEIGPSRVLLNLGQACVPAGERLWLPSLMRGMDDWKTILGSLAALYTRGANIDWSAFDRCYPSRRKVTVPYSPFQREHCWRSVEVDWKGRPAPSASPAVHERKHPVLGEEVRTARGEAIYRSELSVGAPGWIADHRVQDTVLLPAAAYLDALASAGRLAFPGRHTVLRDVVIENPLALSETGQAIQVLVDPPQDDSAAVEFHRLLPSSESNWQRCCHGRVQIVDRIPVAPALDLEQLRARARGEVVGSDCYRSLRQSNLDYGPEFQTIRKLWPGTNESLAHLELSAASAGSAGEYGIHPALLDGAFQSLMGAFERGVGGTAYLPAGLAELTVFVTGAASAWSHARLRPAEPESAERIADLDLYSDSGELLAAVRGLTLRPIAQSSFQRASVADSGIYELNWVEAAREPSATAPDREWVLCGAPDACRRLSDRMTHTGGRCRVVAIGSEPTRSAVAEGWSRALGAALAGSGPKELVYLGEPDLDADVDAALARCLIALQTAAASETPPRVSLVTAGGVDCGDAGALSPAAASLWGLGRVAMQEHPELHVRCIDVPVVSTGEPCDSLIEELQTADAENQVAIRGSQRLAARLMPSADAGRFDATTPFRIGLAEYGRFDLLRPIEMAPSPPGAGEIAIEVCATGLNFRDVLRALGMLHEFEEQLGLKSAAEAPFGAECAGRVTAVGPGVTRFQVGDDVAALALGSLASHVNVPADLAMTKPERLSFVEAATLPLAYLTAWYALVHVARLRSGERVLIHSAAGGVGQAAVQVARHLGAEVFATAGPNKADFLRAQGVRHVYSSRAPESLDELARDAGDGIDVVLNSLSGEFIPRSINALRRGGRFVEIGKLNIWQPEQVAELRPDVAYVPFDLSLEEQRTPGLIARLLSELRPLFESGALPPLPRETFPIERAAEAFRHMAQARHRGKIVLETDVAAAPLFRDDGTYLITGGTGGIGLELLHWLPGQGVRNIALLSRNPPERLPFLDALRDVGVRVEVLKADVGDRASLSAALDQLRSTMPPLRGVLHAAGILDDGRLRQQTPARFARVLAPKVHGARLLAELTAGDPLDFVLYFSSVSALLGTAGQGNYAAANAVLDALAVRQRQAGLRACSIQWGPWDNVGMTGGDRDSGKRKLWAAIGIRGLPTARALAQIPVLLASPRAVHTVVDIDWTRLRRAIGLGPILDQLAGEGAGRDARTTRLRDELAAAPAGQRSDILIAYVRGQIAHVLGLPHPERIAVRDGFFELGLDSLIAVELRNRLETDLGTTLPATLLIDYPTIEAFVKYLEQHVFADLAPASAIASAEPVVAVDVVSPDQYEGLSEQELGDELLRKLTELSAATSN